MHSDSSRYLRTFATLLILAFIGIVVTFQLRTGPVINVRFGHDVLFLLDGAWRILNGQVPHTGFHTVLGPVIFLIVALGMKLGGVSAGVLPWVNSGMFLLLTSWAWLISRRRVSPFTSVLFTLSVGLLVAGTYHLGFDYWMSSYANLYNRYGYAMLFILLFDQYFPTESDDPKDLLVSAVSSGFLLSVLFFLKVTFFLVGALFVLCCLLLFGRSRKWLVWFCLGFLLFLLPLLVYLGFDPGPLLRDYLIPAQARVQGIAHGHVVSHRTYPFAFAINCMVAMAVAMIIITTSLKNRFTLAVLVFFSIMSGIFLNVTNFGFSDMPLLVISGLFPLEYCLRSGASRKILSLSFVFMLAMFSLMNGEFLYKNAASIVFASRHKDKTEGTLGRFDSPPLRNLYVEKADGYGNDAYVTKINDGISLLRRVASRRDRVMAINFENPFSLALGLAPPRGDTLWWHLGCTFDGKHLWPADEIFRDVTLVMIPKNDDPEAATPLKRLYAPYLERNFRKLAESEYWTVERKMNR